MERKRYGAEFKREAVKLASLIEATEKVCVEGSRKSPALVVLKQKAAGATAPTA